MKKMLLTVACSASLVLPSVALANEPVALVVNQPNVELSAVFATNNEENLQVATLSQQEMQDTEGAWIPQAFGSLMGGVGGHFGYMSSAIASGSYNGYAHGASILTGAGMGALSPIKGARSFVNGTRAVVLGTAVGGINGYALTKGQTRNIGR